MASKAHVQDNSVSERRLRPIYEWLDSGNNKKALQECDKVLKKTPNLQCAKALRALAFLRMGKDSECSSILEQLIAENPADDTTLQAITLCYRELQQPEKICTLYEKAVKLDPANEEFHTHLFMSYVRIYDFKAQQLAAMNLYKLKPKNPYYCWAVMSIIQQATRDQGKNDPAKAAILLSLAERMIHKLVAENKLEAEQEVQLYLMILELQNKYKEALDVFNGPLGEKLLITTPGLYKLKYLTNLNRWKDVNLFCKEILTENVDGWNIWKEYINSVFNLMSTEPHLNNVDNCNNLNHDIHGVDDTPEKAHEFICGLVEAGVDNGFQLRGPYLARFELCSKLVELGLDTNDLLGETIELFIEYFRKFGHKPCCVSDLRIYLNLLDIDKKAELSTRLIKDVGISSTSVPQSEQQMQRHLCSLQISRLCGSHQNLSADHLAALVTAFSLHYQHGFQTYGTNLLPTDQGSSDAYAILAAHILYDLAVLTNSSKPIITALVLLKSVLKNTPHCFNAKLLCVRLFHTLGGSIGAIKMYESLDIKHLQMDSLGYIHCARLPTMGLTFYSNTLLDVTLKFFSSNYKDSSDHLTFFYKFGSFNKLDDFMDFREKLNNSLHYVTVAIEKIVLDVIQCTSTDSLYNSNLIPKDNKINWDNLSDNQDLSVYVSWNPERTLGPPEKSIEAKTLFQQNIQFLKLRAHMLSCFSAAVDIVVSQSETKNNLINILKQDLKNWENLINDSKNIQWLPINENILTMPLPSRLHLHLTSPYYEILEPLFKVFIRISLEDASESKALLTVVTTKFQHMLENIERKINAECKSNDCYWNRRIVMEEVVNIIEIINFSALINAMCFDLTKKYLSHSKKMKKKFDSSLKLATNNFSDCIKEVISKMELCLDTWKYSDEFDLADQLALLNLSADGQDSVFEDLKNSHTTAVRDLKTVLKNKLKLLNIVNS